LNPTSRNMKYESYLLDREKERNSVYMNGNEKTEVEEGREK